MHLMTANIELLKGKKMLIKISENTWINPDHIQQVVIISVDKTRIITTNDYFDLQQSAQEVVNILNGKGKSL